MKEKETIAVETQADAQAETQAVEAQAEAQTKQARAKAIERAWEVLISSGVITPEDRAVLESRRRDRQLLALASETLAKGRELGAIAVTVVTPAMIYTAEDGQQPRIAPRVTNAPRRRAKAKSDADEAKPESVEGIPVAVLKRASEALGVKWFGPKNAIRSQRVLAKARELMSTGQ